MTFFPFSSTFAMRTGMKNVCPHFIGRILSIASRELKMYTCRPLFLFCLIVAPLLCLWMLTFLMHDGLPTRLPIAVVDEDNTTVSRSLLRTLEAMEQVDIVCRYASFTEARKTMQRGNIYGIFYIPRNMTQKAVTHQQPTISFYTNECYFVAGSLVMRDMRITAELIGLALTRQALTAQGLDERQSMGIVQPVVINAHPMKNPFLDYSVYLNNMLIPGILLLLVMLSASYTLGLEWKEGTQEELFRMAGGHPAVAIAGKLLPQTFIFTLMFACCHVCFFRILQFPCHSGMLPMLFIGIATILAAQGLAVFLTGMFGQMRMAMSLCSLLGMFSFSLAGFSFPVTAMDSVLQYAAMVLPLRHYYLLYVNQALNGFSIAYAWPSLLALALLVLLPLLLLKRYRHLFLYQKYTP